MANAAISLDSTNFSAKIDRYFTWPETWDVAGLSVAFSPQYAPEAWELDATLPASSAGVLAIIAKVALPAFLWGVGTAIGELPPYFVARAAMKVRVVWRAQVSPVNNPNAYASLVIAGRRGTRGD